jgi:hypothetical protein
MATIETVPLNGGACGGKYSINDACVGDIKIWDGLRRFDAGIQAGINLDFRHYIVGVEGEFGLARMWEKGPRNLGIFATFGYKF